MGGHGLILGGARSGKSSFAERWALTLSDQPAYVATSEAFDTEMEQRIARHRADRDARFVTYEEPLDLVGVLASAGAAHDLVLVDCLTLWISNLMGADRDIDTELEALQVYLEQCPAQVLIVSNEVGLGIVPDNEIARAFRDHAGRAHQQLARICDTVLFVAAGLSLAMKGTSPQLG